MHGKIDTELLKAITNSPFNEIDYEYLLATHPAKIREEELNIIQMDEPLPVPQSLSVENIHIPSSESQRNIRLRIYRPKGKQNLPVLLYFHGGAFIYGTPEQYDFLFFRLALDIDIIVVSVDYRLAPEYPFPAAMEDGYDALQWLSESADHIGGNPNRIIIGGSSAGATIAASVTHYTRDTNKINILHQYLIYPPTDHSLETSSMNELASAPMQTKKAAGWMWKHYLQDQMIQLPQYSVPLQQKNFKNLPAATIIVCELDPLKDEGKEYAKKLENAGVSVTLLEIAGAVHAFDFFPCQLAEAFYQQQVKLFKLILTQKS